MNHGGKCENLHGHNYAVEVTVTGEKTDDVGRVVDFSIIKKLFKGWLDENWDHGFILWDQDRKTIDAISSLNSKLFLLPENPTAENMAAYLLSEVGPALLREVDGQLKLTQVKLWETDESCAVVRSGPKEESTTWLEASLGESQ